MLYSYLDLPFNELKIKTTKKLFYYIMVIYMPFSSHELKASLRKGDSSLFNNGPCLFQGINYGVHGENTLTKFKNPLLRNR